MKDKIINYLENRSVNTLDPFCACFRSKTLTDIFNIRHIETLRILRELEKEKLVVYKSFGGGCMCPSYQEHGCDCGGSVPFFSWEWKGKLLNQHAM